MDLGIRILTYEFGPQTSDLGIKLLTYDFKPWNLDLGICPSTLDAWLLEFGSQHSIFGVWPSDGSVEEKVKHDSFRSRYDSDYESMMM